MQHCLRVNWCNRIALAALVEQPFVTEDYTGKGVEGFEADAEAAEADVCVFLVVTSTM